MNKETLICDFDGVIVNTIQQIVSLYDQDFRLYREYKKLHWTEVNTWNFTELTCASKEFIIDYFESFRFFQNLPFLENAEESLHTLSEKYNIVVCSLGNTMNLKYKREWLEKNMPYVSDFIGIPIKKHKDKSSVDMRGCVFIDDCSNNLVSSNADTKILYGDWYPWNAGWDGLHLFNWTDVVKYLIE